MKKKKSFKIWMFFLFLIMHFQLNGKRKKKKNKCLQFKDHSLTKQKRFWVAIFFVNSLKLNELLKKINRYISVKKS